jgi:hypothetical protein
MKATEQLQQLESVAEKIGVKICYEPMTGIVSGRAGLCRVRGAYRVIVDRRLKPAERVQVVSDALGRFELQAVEMPETIRRLLSPHGGADPRPGAAEASRA